MAEAGRTIMPVGVMEVVVRVEASGLMGLVEDLVIGEVGRSVLVARKISGSNNSNSNTGPLISLSSRRTNSRTSMVLSADVIRILLGVVGMTPLVFHTGRREMWPLLPGFQLVGRMKIDVR